jgi:methionyl-tRNA synthetase
LVAVYGNFVNRALQLTKKYWGGVVPACGELQEVDEKAIAEFKDVKEKVEHISTYSSSARLRKRQ